MTSSLARCSALLAPRLCPLPILVATSQQPRLSCPCIPRWVGRLHLETARARVVTLDDPASADELVAAARRERQDLLIIARARDAAHAVHLYRLGAPLRYRKQSRLAFNCPRPCSSMSVCQWARLSPLSTSSAKRCRMQQGNGTRRRGAGTPTPATARSIVMVPE